MSQTGATELHNKNDMVGRPQISDISNAMNPVHLPYCYAHQNFFVAISWLHEKYLSKSEIEGITYIKHLYYFAVSSNFKTLKGNLFFKCEL